MQFQVPQNIDMEDKIVGPLTLVQFLYLLAGGIIIYLSFLTIKTSILFWVISVPVGAVALALTFLKIQDQSLSYFIKAGLTYLSKPKTRLWRRQGLTIHIVKKPIIKKSNKPAPAPKKAIEKSELEKLAYALDTQGKV